MSQYDDTRWPPDNISDMLAEMRANRDSPHWVQTYLQVRAFAHRYGGSNLTYPDDADDLASDTMEILATPGALEGFGTRSVSLEGATLRKAFLAWLAIIIRRVWTNRIRYYHARIRANSVDSLDEQAQEVIDPRTDVAEHVEHRMLLHTALMRLEELRGQSPRNEAKVVRFLLGALYGVPYQSVARQAGCKPSDVRDAVHDIRGRLRSFLRQYEVEASGPLPAPALAQGQPRKRRTPRPRQSKRPRTSPQESDEVSVVHAGRRSVRSTRRAQQGGLS